MFHVSIDPEHLLRDFWQEGISLRSLVPSALMVFALMPVGMIAGFMLGNVSLWLVPPIRRVFEAQARDHQGTSIGASMRGLFRIGVWVFPIGLATAFVAAYSLKSLR